jgi:hypothetical protein
MRAVPLVEQLRLGLWPGPVPGDPERGPAPRNNKGEEGGDPPDVIEASPPEDRAISEKAILGPRSGP